MNGSGLTGTGNSNADTLVTLGANTLIGGDGNDSFVFSAGSANGATVADFNHDQVTEWDLLVFSGFGTEARARPSARSAIPTSGRSIPVSMATTRRLRSAWVRCMPGISCSCEARPS